MAYFVKRIRIYSQFSYFVIHRADTSLILSDILPAKLIFIVYTKDQVHKHYFRIHSSLHGDKNTNIYVHEVQIIIRLTGSIFLADNFIFVKLLKDAIFIHNHIKCIKDVK